MIDISELMVGDVCRTVYDDGTSLEAISLVTNIEQGNVKFTDIIALNFHQDAMETWESCDFLKEVKVLFSAPVPKTLVEMALDEIRENYPEYML